MSGTLEVRDPEHFFADGVDVVLGDLEFTQLHLPPMRYAAGRGGQDVIEFVHLTRGRLRCGVGGGGAARMVEPGELVLIRAAAGDRLESEDEVHLTRVAVPRHALGPLDSLEGLALLRMPEQLAAPFLLVVDAVLAQNEQGSRTMASALRGATIELARAVLSAAEGSAQGGAGEAGSAPVQRSSG